MHDIGRRWGASVREITWFVVVCRCHRRDAPAGRPPTSCSSPSYQNHMRNICVGHCSHFTNPASYHNHMQDSFVCHITTSKKTFLYMHIMYIVFVFIGKSTEYSAPYDVYLCILPSTIFTYVLYPILYKGWIMSELSKERKGFRPYAGKPNRPKKTEPSQVAREGGISSYHLVGGGRAVAAQSRRPRRWR